VSVQPHEISILLKMYDERIIGKAGYTSIQRVRSKIKWQQIAALFSTKESFDSVARRLVKRRLLSDDGKSLAVLYLDKLGVDFVIGYMQKNPNAIIDLETRLRK
jgi:hypothetical protein